MATELAASAARTADDREAVAAWCQQPGFGLGPGCVAAHVASGHAVAGAEMSRGQANGSADRAGEAATGLA